jgi:aminocarboxymuconate-semialdehyde decarboxylase
VREHPQRFAGLATVPLGDPELAIEELERAITELGLAGVEIGTNIAGAELDDPRFMPFFERASELKAGVFVHPWQVIGGRRLRADYYALYTVAMPAETAFAAAALVFGGVLERIPQLHVLFAHGGGAIPYILPRMKRGWEVWEPAREHAPEPPENYLGRCWFDSITWDEASLEFLVRRVGAGQVVLGTDYPFLMGEDSPGAMVAASDLTSAEKAEILGQSWARLFPLAGVTADVG